MVNTKEKMMRRILTFLLFPCILLSLSVGAADPPKKQFGRGLKPTARYKLASAERFQIKAAPAQYAVVPKKLSMWGNDVNGDCVTAEEAFAKACNSPEIDLDDTTVIAWATAGGYLNGANLTDVMDSMRSNGFVVGPQKYNDGGYTSVDFTNEAVLQSAISQGPVKIGIDANALPSTAGYQQGWYATGGTPGQFSNEDHCVSLSGYGTAQYLYQQLNVPLPTGLIPTTKGYLLFTWSTIGFVDFAWIMSTVGEAWVRNPTTVGVPPLGPPVPPVPPVPPAGNPTLTGITATFSDGSTQTLGGNVGLTAAQLKVMTLQQVMDYIQSNGKPKPPPMPPPIPERTRPMLPAKPTAEMQQALREWQLVTDRLYGRR